MESRPVGNPQPSNTVAIDFYLTITSFGIDFEIIFQLSICINLSNSVIFTFLYYFLNIT